MALLGVRHAQENAFAFLVPFALGQIAIHFRRFDFRPPVALDHFDRLSWIFPVIRWILAFHGH